MGMFTIFPKPSNLPTAQFTQLSVGQLGYAIPFQRRNSQWQQVPGTETQKSFNGAAVASGSSITVWTPGAGNVLYVTLLSISATVTGLYRVLYNAVVIWQGLLVANTTVVLPIPNGGFLYPAAANLQLNNQSGAPADLYMTAWGAEVLA